MGPVHHASSSDCRTTGAGGKTSEARARPAVIASTAMLIWAALQRVILRGSSGVVAKCSSTTIAVTLTMTTAAVKTDRGIREGGRGYTAQAYVRVRTGHRAGGPRPAAHRDQDVLPVPEPLRGRTEHADLPGVPGLSRRPAGAQPPRGRPRRQAYHDPGLRRACDLRLRPQELLLPRPAEGLPDQPVRPPPRGARRAAAHPPPEARPHRAPASRRGRRQAPARGAGRLRPARPEPGRLQSLRRSPGRDRLASRHGERRRGP